MTPGRRHDPGRRDRLVHAARRVLAREGVAAITHRKVAAEANVPLGSTTYHFRSLEELVQAAFAQHVDLLSRRFEERLAAVRGEQALVDALVASVLSDLTSDPEELALTFELYGRAARHPETKELTESWMDRAQLALAGHVDATTARVVDALLEGLMVHVSITRQARSEDELRTAFARAMDRQRG